MPCTVCYVEVCYLEVRDVAVILRYTELRHFQCLNWSSVRGLWHVLLERYHLS